MVDSVTGIASLATQMHLQKTAQDVDIAVFNKAQDLQKEQGQQVLQLLESASVSASGVDVYA